MKKLLLLVVCMFLAGLSTARAQLVMVAQNGYSYGDGGEFTAYTSPNSFTNLYAPTTIINGGFETFCVQSTVGFSDGASYSYVLTNQDSAGQKLNLGTAFLYSQFATGNLTGYDYTDPGTRNTDAGELQLALWTLQNQTIPGPGEFPTLSLSSDPYYNLAITDLGATAYNPNNGTYDVDIMQLYNANGSPAQAMLVLTPEPPTFWLFMFAGVLLIAFNRRKFLRVA